MRLRHASWDALSQACMRRCLRLQFNYTGVDVENIYWIVLQVCDCHFLKVCVLWVLISSSTLMDCNDFKIIYIRLLVGHSSCEVLKSQQASKLSWCNVQKSKIIVCVCFFGLATNLWIYYAHFLLCFILCPCWYIVRTYSCLCCSHWQWAKHFILHGHRTMISKLLQHLCLLRKSFLSCKNFVFL